MRGGWRKRREAALGEEIATRAEGIYCEVLDVIGKHILCDGWVCCNPGVVLKQQPLTLLCCSHNMGIFSLIPIYTIGINGNKQPSQSGTEIKPEVGWENRH